MLQALLSRNKAFHFTVGMFLERDFDHFDKDASSKSGSIRFDFDEKDDKECNENAMKVTEKHKAESDILPVGIRYENFMREVANLKCARPQSSARMIDEQVNDEHTNWFANDVQANKTEEPKRIIDAWNGKHYVECKDDIDFAITLS